MNINFEELKKDVLADHARQRHYRASEEKRIEQRQKFQVPLDLIFAALPEASRVDIRDATSIDLHFSGTKEDFTAVHVALRKQGYAPNSRIGDEPAAEFNSYYEKSNFPKIWIFYSSTVCVRTQIGTRMVEEPIYEVRCES